MLQMAQKVAKKLTANQQWLLLTSIIKFCPSSIFTPDLDKLVGQAQQKVDTGDLGDPKSLLGLTSETINSSQVSYVAFACLQLRHVPRPHPHCPAFCLLRQHCCVCHIACVAVRCGLRICS